MIKVHWCCCCHYAHTVHLVLTCVHTGCESCASLHSVIVASVATTATAPDVAIVRKRMTLSNVQASLGPL